MPSLGGFSRYELLERIGIGGMAEVFRARASGASGEPLDVVVKRILPHHNEETEFQAMFMDEARIAANLDHPNVVRVLDLGRMDGNLFLAMEYVEGADLKALATWIEQAGRRLPIPAALHIATRILEGLHHAHTRMDAMGRPLGIVHRDVTPQNVLIGTSGQVKLTDFGIARAANRLAHTHVGTIKGNLLYIAPEQISGKPVDARADVYSAGMLLHRLLCGRHAFEGDDLPKIYQRSLSGDIPPVSRFNPSVPTNLDRIIARATALVPAQRFATAEEFGRALDEFLRGKQFVVDMEGLCADVRAMRSGLRAAKPEDRAAGGTFEGRVLVSEGSSGQSVLRSVPGAGATAAAPHAGAPAQTAHEGRAVSSEFSDGDDAPTTLQAMPAAESPGPDVPTLETGSGGIPDVAARPIPEPAFDTVPSADPTKRIEPQPEAEVEEEKTNPMPMPAREPAPLSAFLEAATAPPPLPNPFVDTARDPDPTTTAPSSTPPPPPTPRPTDVPVRAASTIIEPSAPSPLAPPPSPIPAPPWEIARPAAGVAAARSSAPAASPRATAAPPAAASVSAPRPTPAPAAAPSRRTPPPSSAVPRRSPPPSPSPVPSPSSAPSVPNPPPPAAAPPAAVPSPVDFSRDDVAESEATRPTMIPAAVAAQLGLKPAAAPDAVLEAHEDAVVAVAAVRTGRFVVSASHDRTLRIWDLTTRKPHAVLQGHAGPVTCVALANDGARVLSGSADQTVRLWNSETGQPVAAMTGHTDWVTAVALAPDGRTALSGSTDRTMRLWDSSTGREQLVMEASADPVGAIAYVGDGTLAVSASTQGEIRMWNLLDGSELASFVTGVAGVRTAALARDGRRLVFGGADGRLRVWDLERGAPQATLDAHQGAVLSVALSPDGARIASAGDDGRVRLWDLAAGVALASFDAQGGAVHGVAFAIDGAAVVAAAARRLCLWDV